MRKSLLKVCASAAAVAFLASPETSYVTGSSMVIDGGLLLMAAVRNADTS